MHKYSRKYFFRGNRGGSEKKSSTINEDPLLDFKVFDQPNVAQKEKRNQPNRKEEEAHLQ